jgi:uncharacterized protein (DUF433 family)
MITFLKNGIHVGTPVFDGAREDVKDLLIKLPSNTWTNDPI